MNKAKIIKEIFKKKRNKEIKKNKQEKQNIF